MSVQSQLPPDRSHVRTEHRHERSMNLDALDAKSIVELITDDHRSVVEAVRNASSEIAKLVDHVASCMLHNGRLVYVGAGTSGRLGVLDASECPPTFQVEPSRVVGIIAGGDSALRRSSEGKEDEVDGAAEAIAALQLTSQDTVVGIAAGGTTPYVLGSLSIAKSSGATTGLIACAPPRGALHDCDHFILLDTGPEVLTGSTRLKAGSATKLALNAISTGIFVRLGKTYSNLMVDLRATNAKLADRAIRILIELCSELSRDQAASLLQRAGGSLKTAVVMQRLDVDADQANQMLLAHQGRLRPIIDGH